MAKKQRTPEWREYEAAVATFLRAIDPRAKVLHDVKRPDLDTGNPRHRDVWVEATIGGLMPVKILVSCKRLQRRVNEQDIDALLGEIRSANAHMGAIFANGGFTAPALKKAAAVGVACCRLYSSEPPELPSVLPMQIYFCVPTISIHWREVSAPAWSLTTFSNLLDLEIEYQGQLISTAVYLAAAIRHFHAESMKRDSDRYAFPHDLTRILVMRDDESGRPAFSFALHLRWRIFRIARNATLLNGAYSYTEDRFLGEQSTEWLPLHDPLAAPVWDELTSRPNTRGTCGVTYFRPLGDVAQDLRNRFGHERITEMRAEFGA